MKPSRQKDSLSLTQVDYKKRIFQAMNYISKNINREVTLFEIANTASFSQFHFHRIFKAVTGENVAEFTRRIRMESAANQLIAFPERDVTLIAISCGFSSSQNFAKAFRLRYETSPSQYRKNRIKYDNHLPLSKFDLQKSARKKIEYLIDVSIREMPEMNAATIRRIGMSPESCMEAFGELLSWMQNRVTPKPGDLLALYWDNPEITSLDKCRFDCCLLISENIIPSDPVFIQKVGGGLWAFCRFETNADGIKKAWEESFIWLVQSGYECRALPCCEIYYNNAQEHPEGKWIFDIAIPLQ